MHTNERVRVEASSLGYKRFELSVVRSDCQRIILRGSLPLLTELEYNSRVHEVALRRR